MIPRLGVVSTVGREAASGRRGAAADSYLVCRGQRAAWFEGGNECAERHAGHGVLVAVSDGDGDTPEAAATAAAAACRVLTKLWPSGPGGDAEQTLTAFLLRAHTRMYWKARARGARMGASLAAAWVVGDRLAWVELGTARVFLLRAGALRHLGVPWAANDAQRLIGGSRGLGDDTALHLENGRNAGTVRLRAGDQVLLATDGLWRALDEASAAHVLQHVDDAQMAAVTLMDRAASRGARDAVTVAVLDLRAVAVPPRPAPPESPPSGSTPPKLRTDAPPVRWRGLVTEPD